MAGRTQLAPTFLDILKDSITKVAEVYWAPYNLNKKEFDIKGTITFYTTTPKNCFGYIIYEFLGSLQTKNNRKKLSN